MSEDDTCDLVRISRAYFDRYRMSDVDLFFCFERFCCQHPDVMDSERYDPKMSWEFSVRSELRQILDGFRNQELLTRPICVKTREFLDTVPLFLK